MTKAARTETEMLRLTPDVLEGAYEYLRASTPVLRKLPGGDDVEFVVLVTRDYRGHFRGAYGREPAGMMGVHPEIAISAGCIGSSTSLFMAVAHEMVHYRQDIDRTGGQNAHNAEFYRLAALVCRTHGWDVKAF